MKRGPELLKPDGLLALFVAETDRGDVIRERVEPNVHRMRWIAGHRHTPAHRSLQTTDGQILKPATHKADHFVSPVLRSHEIRFLVRGQERLVVIREPEKVTLFRNAIEWRVVNEASRRITFVLRFLILVFSLIFSTRSAEPAFVVALVNRVAALGSLRFRDATPELAHALVMKRLGGAHEDVVAAVGRVECKLVRHLFEITDNVIGLFLRRASGFLRGAFDV